jgi:hypothetical protein
MKRKIAAAIREYYAFSYLFSYAVFCRVSSFVPAYSGPNMRCGEWIPLTNRVKWIRSLLGFEHWKPARAFFPLALKNSLEKRKFDRFIYTG